MTDAEYHKIAYATANCLDDSGLLVDGPTRPNREWEYTAGGEARPGETEAETNARVERGVAICSTSLDKVASAYLRTHPLSEEYVRASALRLVDCLRTSGLAVPDKPNPQLAAAMAIHEVMEEYAATGGALAQRRAIWACEDQEPDAFYAPPPAKTDGA